MKLFVNILQDITTLHKGMASVWFGGNQEPKRDTDYSVPANIRFSENRLKPSFDFKQDTQW